jgi:hypothetical protein
MQDLTKLQQEFRDARKLAKTKEEREAVLVLARRLEELSKPPKGIPNNNRFASYAGKRQYLARGGR